MNVIPIPAFTDNYIWALIHNQKPFFDCIDPGDAQPVIQFSQKNNLKLDCILLTHHHADHIGGVAQLKKHFPNCRVFAPKDNRIPMCDVEVTKGEIVHTDSASFQILFNPGHTASHISYFEPQKLWLFCGDTLFSAGCGRVFDGTMEELHHSLEQFKHLPLETKIFCGHEYTLQNLKFAHKVEPQNQDITEYLNTLQQNPSTCSLPSTLKQELKINPFLRTDKAEVIDFALKHGAPGTLPLEVFTTLRTEKNTF